MLKTTQATLFQLAALALVIAPLTPYLPLWCSALALLLLVWRALLAWQTKPLPPAWVKLVGLVVVVVATRASHGAWWGREAGMSLVVALLALKTLELQAKRDAFVAFYLGFFVLLSQFLVSQSLLAALAMVAGCAGLLTALVNAQLLQGQAGLRTAWREALRLMVIGAPVMALLFVLFPRVAPLWGVPDGAHARTGLSDDMAVGHIAHLALDSEVALRVKFDGPAPPPWALYFRGPVLEQWDGHTWRASAISETSANDRTQAVTGASPNSSLGLPPSQTLPYELSLEAHQKKWLLTLDATTQAPEMYGATQVVGRGFQWQATQAITHALRYRAAASLDATWNHPLTPEQMQEALYLPPGNNPRTVQWAAQWQADSPGTSADAWVQRALDHLSRQGYRYTLNPAPTPENAADAFWFDTKEGFCEHMASSFVILMRALGVPARVVTGYQGGEANPLGGHWVVRQSDAHAWAEVWMPPAPGAAPAWVRVDPTGAVAPARLQGATRLQARGGPVATIARQWLGEKSVAWLAKAGRLWEATQYLWQQTIIDFGQNQQLRLLRAMGFDSPSLQDLGQVLAASLLLALVAWAVLQAWQRQKQDPWQALWQRVSKDLTKAGWRHPLNSTPRQLAQMLVEQGGEAAAPQVAWLIRLEQARYGPEPAEGGRLAELRREWEMLKSRRTEPASTQSS